MPTIISVVTICHHRNLLHIMSYIPYAILPSYDQIILQFEVFASLSPLPISQVPDLPC